MTPEEVKKRFEKAIEAMFASASRQLGDIENKALDVIDSLHLMGSAMEGIAFDDGVIRSFSELLGKFKDAPMLINNVIKMSENFSDAWDAVSSAFRSAGSETEKTSSKVKDSAKSLDESKKAASGLKDKLDESSAAADAAKDKLAETADAAKNGLGEASGAADAAKNKLGETASAAGAARDKMSGLSGVAGALGKGLAASTAIVGVAAVGLLGLAAGSRQWQR